MATPQKPSLALFETQFSQAVDIQNRSPLAGFYVKNHVLTQAVEFLKAEKSQGRDISELTRDVQAWFQDLEGVKKSLGSQVQVQEQSRKQYYEFANNLFLKCNTQYQNGEYSPQLAGEFANVVLLFDAYTIFNSPSKEIDDYKKYAISAVSAINQALQAHQSKSTVHNPHNANQSTNYQSQGQNNTAPFGGFQAAESVFVPKSSLDQARGGPSGVQGTSVMGKNAPISNTTTTSVYQQGPPQGFQSHNFTQQNVSQGNNLPDFGKFSGVASQQGGPQDYLSLSQAINNSLNVSPHPQQGGNPTGFPAQSGNIGQQPGFGGPITPNVKLQDQYMPKQSEVKPPVQESRGIGNVQNAQNVQNVQNVQGAGRSEQSTRGAGTKTGNAVNISKEKMDELRDLCMMTISELDYKNVTQAKENIKRALSMVKEIDPSI